ncbi:MBOAT family protein [Clostridium sp. CTA-7]
MVFSSLIFIFMFLPSVLIIYYLVPNRFKNLVLFISSIVFYVWGEPIYIVLMIFSILINYLAGLLIKNNAKDKSKRKFIFFTVVLIDISVLLFFKYYGFLISNINWVFGSNLEIRELPLPLGISFYTFQLISYIVDVYMDKVKAQKNIIDFGAYISMFPQLVAGPIVKYSDIESQLKKKELSIDKFGQGVERFILGLGKKVLIANNLGAIWQQVKIIPIDSLTVLTGWIGIISFTLQIYYDFSGYSDMAIGLGKMLGFEFLENFNYPYMSKSITEFWRRWHISLGSWFKEYIYIPLGGNRRGNVIQFRNLMIVWFTTGLWHGASWNFIIWGLYFGLIIYSEKIFLKSILKNVPNIIAHIYTMTLVAIGWIFFDLSSLNDAIEYIKVILGLNGNKLCNNFSLYLISTNLIILIIAIILSTDMINKTIKDIKKRLRERDIFLFVFIELIILIISTAYLIGESYNPFLYFRF